MPNVTELSHPWPHLCVPYEAEVYINCIYDVQLPDVANAASVKIANP
jgi:hypothetical protein